MATGTRRSRDEELLISAAETIGSTLGTLAAKAGAAAKAVTGRKFPPAPEAARGSRNRGERSTTKIGRRRKNRARKRATSSGPRRGRKTSSARAKRR